MHNRVTKLSKYFHRSSQKEVSHNKSNHHVDIIKMSQTKVTDQQTIVPQQQHQQHDPHQQSPPQQHQHQHQHQQHDPHQQPQQQQSQNQQHDPLQQPHQHIEQEQEQDQDFVPNTEEVLTNQFGFIYDHMTDQQNSRFRRLAQDYMNLSDQITIHTHAIYERSSAMRTEMQTFLLNNGPPAIEHEEEDQEE